MRIGLTYDLREDYLALGFSADDVAEFDRRDTIDHLEAAITAHGRSRGAAYTIDRIGHARLLVERLARGDRWDLVFNIAEGLGRYGRESAVPALLEHYGIPTVFSDALVCGATLHKGVAKSILRDRGIPTTAFALVEKPADIDRVLRDLGTVDARAGSGLTFPLFAKPVAEGSSKGISTACKATDAASLRAVCLDLLKRFRQPVIIEPFLPGREFTVGLTGYGDSTRVVAVMEVGLRAGADPEIYTYTNKEDCETLVHYFLAHDELAQRSGELAVRAWNALGCVDGGRVDVRADAAGRPQVLEVNPLPGLHPEHSDLPIMSTLAGISYDTLIGRIMDSALDRMRTNPPAAAQPRTPTTVSAASSRTPATKAAPCTP